MISYNRQWLDALALKGQALKWQNSGLLSQDQLQAIGENFPAPFYTPNTFVRIGLGIFCCILVTSVFGLIGMTLIESLNSEVGTGMACLLFSALLIAALEYFIRTKFYYQAGIDDALLYMALGLATTGVCLLLSPVLDEHLLFYCLLILPFLVAGAIRYTDTVATFFGFVCVVAIVFLSLKESPVTSKLLPLACMLLGAGVYYWVWKNKRKEELRFWHNCLLVLEACSLVLFYASGNYFIVEDVGKMLSPDFTIPYSFIFWILTAIIPLAYVYAGLQSHDRLLLRIGLLMVALSVITFKYYFSLGHYEVTLTVAGMILISLAYFCIRYLKNTRTSFTYAEDKSEALPASGNTEALLVAQSFGVPVTTEKEFEFGGGKFGGGGAGGNY